MKTNLKISTTLVAAALIGAATFSACKKDSNNSSGSNSNGTYNMYMTDAPGNYQQVNVNIVGAQVYNQSQGWVSLNVKAGVYNLLNLSNGKDTLIASGSVSASTVTQVRLLIASTGNTVMVNGTLYNMSTSASLQGGLTVAANSTVTANGSTNIIVDFDAGSSVIASGSNTYTLKPVLRVNNAPTNGTIQGTISPSGSQYAVLAIAAATADTATTFSASVNGGFQVQNLASGTYSVVVLPQPPYTIQTITGVQVSGGQVTNMGTVTLH